MKKTDQNTIIALLIISIIFTIINPMTVVMGANEITPNINSNPELESAKFTAKMVENRVLLSNGTLWKANPDLTATLEDTNVKDYNYVYGTRSSRYNYNYYFKLKINDKLNIKITKGDDDEKVIATSEIANVKQIIEQERYDYMGYLTKDNKVYYVEPNYYNPDKIEPQLIDTDVKAMMGIFYIKDGKTYHISGKKILDTEIDKAMGVWCAVGPDLYYCNNNGYVYKKADNFKDFAFEANKNGNIGSIKYYTTENEIKGNIDENGVIQTTSRWSSSDSITYRYSLYKDNNLYCKYNGIDGNGLLMLTNVVDMKVYDEIIIVVRSDGSVWENKVCELTDFIKVISQEEALISTFKDIKKGEWYYNAVKYVYINNIIKGYNETEFAPNDKLTRGQLVTILHRMEESPKITGKPKFSDVQDSTQYYYNAVKWATDKKIVSGYDNGKFGAEDNITREQLAVILYKYAKYKGKSVLETNNLSTFKDTSKISIWALTQVKWAVGAGVITGNADKTLNPAGNATRAEVAAMLEKYCKNVGR